MYKAPLASTYQRLDRIPVSLLYKIPSEYSCRGQECFKMCSTKSGKLEGLINLSKVRNCEREDYQGVMLGVDFIYTRERGVGNGEKLLDFAKNYSKENGCNGYVVLKSVSSYTPYRIPHLFYRKRGFSSLDEQTDRKMDKFIKQGKDANYKDFPAMLMYYPPLKIECTGVFEKVLEKLKSLRDYVFGRV